MMARKEMKADAPRYALMPANSAMLIGPLMFFADTCPVTIRHSICTVSADISQVFATPLDVDGNVSIRRGIHHGDEFGAVDDRPAVHGQHPIPGAKAGTRARAVARHIADDG